MKTVTDTIPVTIKDEVIAQLSGSAHEDALKMLHAVPGYGSIATNLLNRLSIIDDKRSSGLWDRDKTNAHYDQLTNDILELLSGEPDDLSAKASSPFLPLLPNNYIKRSEFFTIEEALLLQSHQYYGITGLPGCGKTVLASALARSKKIQLAFENNVFWVGIGEKTQDKLTDPSPVPYQEQLLLQLNNQLTGKPEFKNWQQGLIALQNEARERFSDTKCLIIVDHPPGVDDLMQSIGIHENATFLVITSDSSLLYSKGIQRDAIFSIKGMEHEEAIQLLSSWSELNTHEFSEAAEQIVAKLDHLPLAIAMTGASLKGSIDPIATSADILDAIKEGDLDDISQAVDTYHSVNLTSLFRWTVSQLEQHDKEKFHDLGIFPQGWQFEFEKLLVIWNETPERKVRKLVQRLVDKALMQQVGESRFVIHNLVRLYIRNEVKDPLPLYQRILPLILPAVPLLVIASAWNDETMLKRLLQVAGVNIDEETTEGLTALNIAAIRGYEDIIYLLLKQGALIDHKNKYGKTALMMAGESGQTGIVTTLIQKGANINIQDGFGFTALHQVAELGYIEIVRLLLKNGATPNLPNQNHNSPLYLAASEGHVDVIVELLKYKPLADHLTHPLIRPMSFAAGNGHIPAVKALLDAGEDVNHKSGGDGTTVLHYVAELGNAAVADFLIKAGANTEITDKRGFTSLHFAAKSGHVEVVKILIAAGANVDAVDGQNFTSLHYAANAGYSNVTAALIDGKANVDLAPKQVTPLHFAAMILNKEIVKMLLNAGAQVDLETGDGYTALLLAVYYHGQLVLNSFTQASPISITKDGPSQGETNTMAFDDGIEVIKALLEHGASPDVKTDNGYYPLHFAIGHTDAECVKLLLAAGASKEVKDASGATSPELAVRSLALANNEKFKQECEEIIRLLQ